MAPSPINKPTLFAYRASPSSNGDSSSSSGSSCSEVDWSWVEEVEPECRRSTAGNHQQSSNEEPAAAAAAAAIGGESPTTSGGASTRRMRSRQSAGCESDASVAMSVAAAGKTSEPSRDTNNARIVEAQLLRAAAAGHEDLAADLARINAASVNER